MSAPAYPAKLDELVAMFDGLPRQDRIDLLLEFSRALPPVPEHLKGQESARQEVHECMTPTALYVEAADDGARFYVETAESAPTIAAVAAVLSEGCEGATREEILAIPDDIPVRIIGPEMVGQRRLGLMALVNRIKRAVGALN